jgi:hypothetical protein
MSRNHTCCCQHIEHGMQTQIRWRSSANSCQWAEPCLLATLQADSKPLLCRKDVFTVMRLAGSYTNICCIRSTPAGSRLGNLVASGTPAHCGNSCQSFSFVTPGHLHASHARTRFSCAWGENSARTPSQTSCHAVQQTQ